MAVVTHPAPKYGIELSNQIAKSTQRQYALRDKACALGWSQEQVSIIDDDFGLSPKQWVRIKSARHQVSLES